MKKGREMKFLQTSTIALTAAACVVASHARADCTSAGELAYTIMEARQGGMSLDDTLKTMLGTIAQTSPGKTAVKTLVKNMVLEAYEVPRYGTAEYQIEASGDYRDKVQLICLRTTGE